MSVTNPTDPTTSVQSPETPANAPSMWSRLVALFRGSGRSSVLARGASWSVILAGSGMALGFLTQIILTRLLGDEGFGVYAYALAWINTLVMLTTGDFGVAALRFIGAYAGGREWGKLRAFLTQIRSIVLVISLAVAAILAVILWANASAIEPFRLSTYFVACALLPVLALLGFFESTLQGFKRVVLAQAPSLVVRPVLFISLLLGASWLWSTAVSPVMAISANLVAAAAALAVAQVGIWKAIPTAVREVTAESELGLWIKTTIGLLAISFSQLVLSGQIDIVVVGVALGPTEAGLYALAMLFGRVAYLGVEAVAFIATPMISEVYRHQSQEDFQRLISAIVKMQALVGFPLLIGLILCGKLVLRFVFGPEFEGAYPILVVTLISAAQGLLLGGSSTGYVMSMTGNQNSAAWIVAASALVYVVLVTPLTRAFGATGTALATLLAFTFRNSVYAWFLRSRLHINPTPLWWPVRA